MKLQRIGERSERIKEVLSYEFKDAENEKTMESLVTLLELTVSADKGGQRVFSANVDADNLEIKIAK